MNIHIPTPLRAYTAGEQTVSVPGATVGEALEQLTGAYPELRAHLFTGEGKLRSFVNVYLNDDDIRYLPSKEATPATEKRRADDYPLHCWWLLSLAAPSLDEPSLNHLEESPAA